MKYCYIRNSKAKTNFELPRRRKLKGHRQDSISLRVARLEGKHCSSVNRVVITATERKPVSSSPGTSDDERTLQDSTRGTFFRLHVRRHLAVMMIICHQLISVFWMIEVLVQISHLVFFFCRMPINFLPVTCLSTVDRPIIWEGEASSNRDLQATPLKNNYFHRFLVA